MTILLAHELGHYFACRYYGIDASLPYFLPFPSPIGTLGAFIRIRSPIYTRQALFDVGIAGPLAGFAVLLPALVIGIGESKVIPGIAERGDLIFGVPAIQRIFEWIIFPHVRSADILLHPVARAAWVGTLATALNLLPDRAIGRRPHPLRLRRTLAQGAVADVRAGLDSAGDFLFAELAGLGGSAVLLRAAASGDLRRHQAGQESSDPGASRRSRFSCSRSRSRHYGNGRIGRAPRPSWCNKISRFCVRIPLRIVFW